MSGDLLDLEATYRAFFEGAVQRRLERDAVRVAGPAAREYLQGQCTQDLAPLAPGESRFTLLLSVQGKVEALARVTALEPEVFLLDTEVGQGDVLFERLRRFKVRVKADLEQLRLPAIELRGPRLARLEPARRAPVLALPPFPGGPAGVDLLGLDHPEAAGALLALEGVPEGDPAAFEAARIEAGIPRAPEELDGSVIPFEAGIVEATTSFTKGCYTGQELVARLEARGANVPRRLRGVLLPPSAPDAAAVAQLAGSGLAVGGKIVGRITSAAWSPRTGSAVALAYVGRAVEPPAVGELVAVGVDAGAPAGNGTRVQIDQLPLSAR